MKAQNWKYPLSSFRSNRFVIYAGVSVAIFAVVITALFTLLHLRHQAEVRATLSALNMTRSIDQTVEGMIATIDITLLSSADELGRQTTLGEVDKKAATAYLARQLERLPHISYLRATNERGDIIYGPGVLLPPNNISDRDYFIQLRDTPNANFLVSRHLIGRIAGKWAWLFIRRINKSDGTFGGVVFAGILADQIEDLFSRFHLDSGGSIALRNSEMGMIARYTTARAPEIAHGDKRISIPFVEALKANPQEGSYISGPSSIDGISRLHAYHRNQKYGFLINVGIAGEDALADWYKQAGIVTVLAATFIATSLIFAGLISRAWRRQEQNLEALEASQQSLNEAQHIASLGRYSYDLENNYWTSCDILDGIFGIDRDFTRDANHWLELIAKESRQEMQAYLNRIIEQRLPFDHEYRIVHQGDGKERWVHGKGRLQLDDQGNPIRLVGTIQDITARKQVEEALRKSEEHFRYFFEKNASVMLVVDPASGRIIAANKAATDYYGYPIERLIGTPTSEINALTPECLAEEELRALREERDCFHISQRLASGEVRDVEVYLTPIERGGRPLLFSVVHDITERKQAEAKLRLAATVFIHAREGILITEPDGTIIDVNETFSRITGYSREEALGQNPRIFRSGHQSKEFYTALWHDLIEKGYWFGEIWNRHKNGEMYAEMLTISAVRDAQGKTQQYVGLFSDITSLKEHERKLERMAHYDVLTGLPNRVMLADRLQQAMAQTLRRSERLLVCYLDLDGFKTINDNYGHGMGDQLLVGVANRMKESLRESDTLARIGGDEFVAVLLDLKDDDAFQPMLSRLIAAAAQPVLVGELVLQVSASLGVTFYPQERDVGADQLLRQADQAMYQAKQAGKNRYQIFEAAKEHDL